MTIQKLGNGLILIGYSTLLGCQGKHSKGYNMPKKPTGSGADRLIPLIRRMLANDEITLGHAIEANHRTFGKAEHARLAGRIEVLKQLLELHQELQWAVEAAGGKRIQAGQAAMQLGKDEK